MIINYYSFMVYINKYVKMHDVAYKYYKRLGFIINDNIKKLLDFINNDKLKHYCKYDKIGLNKFKH